MMMMEELNITCSDYTSFCLSEALQLENSTTHTHTHTHTLSLSLSLSLSQVAPRRQRAPQHEIQRLKTQLNRSLAGGTLTVPRPRFAHGERRCGGGAPFCLASAAPVAARRFTPRSPANRPLKYAETGGVK